MPRQIIRRCIMAPRCMAGVVCCQMTGSATPGQTIGGSCHLSSRQHCCHQHLQMVATCDQQDKAKSSLQRKPPPVIVTAVSSERRKPRIAPTLRCFSDILLGQTRHLPCAHILALLCSLIMTRCGVHVMAGGASAPGATTHA